MLFTTAACFAGVRLEVAPAVQTLMMIVLGLMIGSAFTPELLAGLPLWSVSLSTLPILIAVGAAVAWLYFRRLGRFDAVTAYFCASPGGMADMILLGGALGGNVRAIGLTRAIRVFLEPSPVLLTHSDRAILGQGQESAAERSQCYAQGA